MKKAILFLAFLVLVSLNLYAQQTETKTETPEINKMPLDSMGRVDSVRKMIIRRTTRRSAMVPGWGQISNKQAWKLPFVYGAIGATVFVFFNNVGEYRGLRQAYIYRTDTFPGNDILVPERYKPLTTNSIRFYRDEFRRNVDYSVIAFLIAWGLNVVDAAVFANLKDFDVSDDLTLKLNPPQINMITGFTQVGVALQFKEKNKQLKPLPTR